MIEKDDLKGKYVSFRDKHGAFRTERVVKVQGNYLTVRHIVTISGKTYKLKKQRIHLDQVQGRCLPKREMEEIKWQKKNQTK